MPAEIGSHTYGETGFGLNAVIEDHVIPTGATAVVVLAGGEDWGNGDPTGSLTIDIDLDTDAFAEIVSAYGGNGRWGVAYILTDADPDWPASLPATVDITINAPAEMAFRCVAVNFDDTASARGSQPTSGTGTDVGMNGVTSDPDDVVIAGLWSTGNATVTYDAAGETGFEELERRTDVVESASGIDIAIWKEEGASPTKDVGVTLGSSQDYAGIAVSLQAPGGSTLALDDANPIAAVSATVGALDGRPGLAATVAAASTFAGAMAGRIGLSGTAAAISAVTASLDTRQGFAGTVPGASQMAGELAVFPPLAGTITAQSTFSGILDTRQGLAGSIAAASALAGGDILPDLSVTAGEASDVPGGQIAFTLSGYTVAPDTIELEHATGSIDITAECSSITSGGFTWTIPDVSESTYASGFPYARVRFNTNLTIRVHQGGNSATATVQITPPADDEFGTTTTPSADSVFPPGTTAGLDYLVEILSGTGVVVMSNGSTAAESPSWSVRARVFDAPSWSATETTYFANILELNDAAALAAVSTMAAGLDVRPGLSGAVAGASLISGDMALGSVDEILAGSMASVSAMSGALDLRPGFVGTVAAASALAGVLEIPIPPGYLTIVSLEVVPALTAVLDTQALSQE